MLIEAVSVGVPWTAQRHGTRIGYVQVHYELGRNRRAYDVESNKALAYTPAVSGAILWSGTAMDRTWR